jgi:N-acyl-D-aspartate/D-glutamate deacylase
MLDILIRGGSVVDGSGRPGVAADVAICGDRVVAVEPLPQARAQTVIDATGLTVAPGFIDIHTHSDFTLLVDGRADSAVCQGVTTEVVGQCGFSAAPLGRTPDPSQMLGHIEVGVALDWRSFGDYLDRLQAAGPAVNVAALVGHGALVRAAGDGGPQAMQALAEDAFDAGAWGLSTGLEYWPGNVAATDQIDRLAAVAGRRGRLYASHVRNRDVDIERGLAEALRTARGAGARLQISHIQPKFGAPPGAMPAALVQLDAAEADGVDVAFDVIPHEWSHTVVVACLPAWAREGGVSATLARLRDPAQRARMAHNPNPIWRLVPEQRWDRIVLLQSRAHPELVGLGFVEIAARLRTRPFDAVLDLLIDEGEGLAQLLWTARNFEDADICLCLRDRRCSVMSDTLSVSTRGPLAGVIGSLSGYGWTARLLGGYARERGVLTLPEAVHRISGRPAARLGLVDRGMLRCGALADVVVFDAGAVDDRATAQRPQLHPGGFAQVIVNGVFVLRDGQRNHERPGRVLRCGE